MSTYTKAEAETRRARSRWAAPAACVAHGSHLSSQNRKFIWIPKRDKTLIKRHRGNGTRHNATAHFAGRRAGG